MATTTTLLSLFIICFKPCPLSCFPSQGNRSEIMMFGVRSTELCCTFENNFFYPEPLIFHQQICRVVEDNAQEAVQAAVTDAPPSHKLRKNLLPLEHIFEDVNRILTPSQRETPTSGKPESTSSPSPPSSSLAHAAGSADASAAEPPAAAVTGSNGGVKEEGAAPNGTSEKSERVIVLDE